MYVAQITHNPAEGNYTINFRDIPEACYTVEAADYEEAKIKAGKSLCLALEQHEEFNKELPYPSEPEEGEIWIHPIA